MEKQHCLRGFLRHEVPLYEEWMKDPTITGRFVKVETTPLQDLFNGYDQTGWQTPELMRWLFCSPSGEILGFAQAWTFDFYESHMEVGRVLLPAYRGQGLGSLFMKLIFNELFSKLPQVHRLQGITSTENLAAIKTFEQAGMRVEGTLRGYMSLGGKRQDAFIAGILRSDWENIPTSKSFHL